MNTGRQVCPLKAVLSTESKEIQELGIIDGRYVASDKAFQMQIERPGSSFYYIPEQSVHQMNILGLLEDVLLNPEESQVLKAVQIIEPEIEKIATIHVNPKYVSKYGPIIVKLQGVPYRVPLGSMGRGVYTMLGIALAAIKARGGYLLVDEIGNGLHYSAMQDMWRMLAHLAKEYDIQIFATTHSLDCIYSLAAVASPEAEEHVPVSLYRIEPEHERAIGYHNEEIRVVAQDELEVR